MNSYLAKFWLPFSSCLFMTRAGMPHVYTVLDVPEIFSLAPNQRDRLVNTII